jgi:hypothetical protein
MYKYITQENKERLKNHMILCLCVFHWPASCTISNNLYDCQQLLKCTFSIKINYTWENNKVYENPGEKFFLNPCHLHKRRLTKIYVRFLSFSSFPPSASW